MRPFRTTVLRHELMGSALVDIDRLYAGDGAGRVAVVGAPRWWTESASPHTGTQNTDGMPS